MRPALLCALAGLAVLAAPARAQTLTPVDSVAGPVLPPEPQDEANHAPDPNRVPYETETSLGEHVLALPASLWSGVAYVFRSAVLYAEYSGTIARAERLLQETPSVYALPTASIGGRQGLTGGLTVFATERFLGPGWSARLGGSYSADGSYSAFGRVADRSALGSPLGLALGGGYYRDAEESFYDIGNDSDEERLDYASRWGLVGLTVELPLGERVRLITDGEFKHYEVLSVDQEDRSSPDGESPVADVPGFGGADFLSAGALLTLDFSEAGGLYAPRTYQGTALLLGLRYGTDISTSPATGALSYLRTSAELRQFVPVPLLPFDRRLALRARLERTNAPGDDDVPFYELSTLGGPEDLRGYRYDRFREQGSLLLTAEYRYPIFNTFDAVLFADAGQVFDDLDEIAFDRFHTDFGGGLRLYGGEAVAARLEVAFTPEGSPRVIAAVGATF